RIALREAEKGRGRTHPNPAVGALVVRNGRIIARGHHQKAGGPHAEVLALRKAGPKARGADLYVTLEPCNHTGRTPPCTEAILAAGIRTVYFGMADPNPRVTGQGGERLREAGVLVQTGILEAECLYLNEAFSYAVQTGRPYTVLKLAMTLDGKIATRTGNSHWVTGPAARLWVH